MSSSQEALKLKVAELVKKMIEALPPKKVLTVEVCITVLSAKLKHPPADFEVHRSMIADLIASKQKEHVPLVEAMQTESNHQKCTFGSSSEEDDSDEDASDGEAEGDDDEEEESEDGDEASSTSGGEDAQVEPVNKRSRSEEPEKLSLQDQLAAMKRCLNKLHLKFRPQKENESAEGFLEAVLKPAFVSNGLDPTKFGVKDTERYKMRKEVEALKKDGANVALNRNQRRGRADFEESQAPQPRKSYMDDD